MKKTITILSWLVVLTIFPVRTSKNAGITSTKAEKKAFELKIRRDLLLDSINNEYDLFYANLHNNRNYDFIVEFLDKISCDALDSKSLPSISIAQACLETGYGQYNKLGNNLFGIKGSGITTLTNEYYNGRLTQIKAEFQYFETIKDAFDKHYQILNRYGVKGRSYDKWIDSLVDCGYATDPLYDMKLKKIIEKYQLYRLDKIQKLYSLLTNIEKECNFEPNLTYNLIWQN